MPAVLNAANEVAVELFLKESIGFTQIAKVVEAVVSEHSTVKDPNLDDILEADDWGRRRAREIGRACRGR